MVIKKIINKILMLFVIIAMVIFMIATLGSTLNKIVIPATFILAENPGFGSMDGEILFGAIPENQSPTRSVLLSNDFDEEILISIKSRGEISGHIIVSENNFILMPNESREIYFTAYTFGLWNIENIKVV